MHKATFALFILFEACVLLEARSFEEGTHAEAAIVRFLRGAVLSKTFPEDVFSFLLPTADILYPNLSPYEWNLLKDNTTHPCLQDLAMVIWNIKEFWAWKMFDSYGKINSGILQANIRWPGDYEECLMVEAQPYTNSSRAIKGRYCSATYEIPLLKNFTGGIAQMAAPGGGGIQVGICVPHTCNGNILMNITGVFRDLISFLMPKNSSSPIELKNISCPPLVREWSPAAIIVLFLISLFGFLVVSGTAVTVVDRFLSPKLERIESRENGDIFDSDANVLLSEKERKPTQFTTVKRYLQCFCLLTNGSRLLKAQPSSSEDLHCVHGVRFLSMAWVILGHSYAFSTSGALRNMGGLWNLVDNWPFQIILQGPFAVDSFFLMSGFLLAHIFLRAMNDRNGKMSWGYFYLHRYWRLTPVYAMVLAFQTTVTKYLGSGPFWPENGNDPGCQNGWWRNLLYINNFARPSEACMSWAWYLANDMQFYVISPLFLYPLWRWPGYGLVIITCLLCGSWVATGLVSYNYDLFAGYAGITEPTVALHALSKMVDYFDKLYIKPYCRISPYLIGVLLAYVLFKTKQKKTFSGWEVTVCGWVLSTTLFLVSLFSLYHVIPSTASASFYNALIRSVFSVALAWVFYACLTEKGGFVNTILSFKFFVPLSRLTYCAYLVHPIVMYTYYQSLRTTTYMTHPLAVFMFFSFLVAAYGIALIVSLVFEAPLMLLEKQLIKQMKLSIN